MAAPHDDSSENDWLALDAPMYAQTFDLSASDFGDSWFDSVGGDEILAESPLVDAKIDPRVLKSIAVSRLSNVSPGPNRSVGDAQCDGAPAPSCNTANGPAANGHSSGLGRSNSYEIITPDKELDFSGGSAMPEPIDKPKALLTSTPLNGPFFNVHRNASFNGSRVGFYAKKLQSPVVGIAVPQNQPAVSISISSASKKDRVFVEKRTATPVKQSVATKTRANDVPLKTTTGGTNDGIAGVDVRKKIGRQPKKPLTQVKPFTFATDKRLAIASKDDIHVKEGIKKAASSLSLKTNNNSEKDEKPRMKRSASSSSVQHRRALTKVQPFNFATDKRTRSADRQRDRANKDDANRKDGIQKSASTVSMKSGNVATASRGNRCPLPASQRPKALTKVEPFKFATDGRVAHHQANKESARQTVAIQKSGSALSLKSNGNGRRAVTKVEPFNFATDKRMACHQANKDQRDGIQKSGSTLSLKSDGGGRKAVTKVKPFNFATDKRMAYRQANKDQGDGIQKSGSTLSLKSNSSGKGMASRCPSSLSDRQPKAVTKVQPFNFATDGRRMATKAKASEVAPPLPAPSGLVKAVPRAEGKCKTAQPLAKPTVAGRNETRQSTKQYLQSRKEIYKKAIDDLRSITDHQKRSGKVSQQQHDQLTVAEGKKKEAGANGAAPMGMK